MPRRLIRIGFAIGLLLPAEWAWSCARCNTAIMWATYPPLVAWGWLGYGWAFIYWALSWRHWSRPALDKMVILMGMLLLPIISGAGGGLVLLGLCLLLTIRLLIRNRQDLKVYREKMALGAFIACAVTGVWVAEWIRPTAHGPRNVILEWPSSAAAGSAMKELLEREPQNLELFRQVLNRTDGLEVEMAALHLIRAGEPRHDIPLVIRRWQELETAGQGHLLDEVDIELKWKLNQIQQSRWGAAEWSAWLQTHPDVPG